MRRILAIQTKRIGDVILTAPALHVLTSTFPHATIAVVMDGACKGVEALLPGIDALYFYKGRTNLAFWRTIIFERWDLCLEFTGTDRGALVAASSRANLRATYARHAGSILRRMVFNRFVESDVKMRHTIDHHLDLLSGIGFPTDFSNRGISVSPAAAQVARDFLVSRGIGKKFAVIHPGAARAEKMWGAENWVRIGEFLRSSAKLDVVLTGGGNTDELEQIKQIVSRSSNRVFSLAGETTLENLAAIISHSRLYVGVDTGAGHIADALGVPSIVLFGSTNPLHWGPRGLKGRAVGAEGISSYPHNFRKSTMQAIPASHVEEAIWLSLFGNSDAIDRL